jgi:hypothetical protein
MKKILPITLLFLSTICFSQKISKDKTGIEKAKSELMPALQNFFESLVSVDLDSNINRLLQFKEGKLNNYERYLIGSTLYAFDEDISIKLGEEAYKNDSTHYNIIFEYALDLHRKKRFNESKYLFEKLANDGAEDYQVYLFLSECAYNLGDIDKGYEYWSKTNHQQNHIEIDNSIHLIHGRSNQFRKRNQYLKEIKNGKFEHATDLIFLDANWEMDWWNTVAQKFFLEHDLEIIKTQMGENVELYKLLKIYGEMKKSDLPKKDKFEPMLKEVGYFINKKPFPKDSKIGALILSLALDSYIIEPRPFYAERKNELKTLCDSTNEIKYLNILAYLQATIDGKVKPELDKLGWDKFHDERFAKSYFQGLNQSADNCKILEKALKDFPESSALQRFEYDCIKNDKAKVKKYFSEIIVNEFKSLKGDESRYSYTLKNYILKLKELK